MSDELRTLRERLSALYARADSLSSGGPSTAFGLFQVYREHTVPTATPRYFACHPVDPGGTEVEGGPFTGTADTDSTAYVAVFGSKIPKAGDYLIASIVGGRWVTGVGQGQDGCHTSPCDIPFIDLILNVTALRAPQLGISTYTMTYSPPGIVSPIHSWSTGFVSVPPMQASCVKFTLSCSAPEPFFGASVLYNGPCGPGGQFSNCSTNAGNVARSAFSCSPFMLQYKGCDSYSNGLQFTITEPPDSDEP